MVNFHDETLDAALLQLRRSAWRVSFAKRLGIVFPALVFLAGAWVLLARFVFDVARFDAAWGLVLVVLAPVICWRWANQEVPSGADLVAWLDQRSGGGGQILTQFELGDERWKRSAAVACHRGGATNELPDGRLQGAVLGGLPAGLFVALALWFSPPAPAAGLPLGLFDRALESLAERIAEMEGQDLGPDVSALAERLEKLAAGLEDGGMEQAFESLDRFKGDLERLASEHSETLAGLRESAMAAAEGAADQLRMSLMKAMLNPKNAALMASLAKQFGDMGDLGSMSDMDLSKLGGQLSKELAGKLADMAQAGFIDQEALQRALARRADPKSLKGVEFKHAPDCDSRFGGL